VSLDLADCALSGAALPVPFLRDGLVLPRDAGDGWGIARAAAGQGSVERVHRSVTVPIGAALGYGRPKRAGTVATREGAEDGGWLLPADGAALRAWSVGTGTPLDDAGRRGVARAAQRVLFAAGERAGLLTDGERLRLLLCDPARPDSALTIGIDGWAGRADVPDSFRVLMALAGARYLPNLPAVLDAARLHQARVTASLRVQAREAIAGFLNAMPARPPDAQALWREALVLVYRLLFVLKLESPGDPAAALGFAATALWRGALSPNRALGPLVRRHLDQGHDTGRMLEDGLRALFAVFRDGVCCAELRIAPLAGRLFGAGSTPLLDSLAWGERAVALLLDRLIWTGSAARARVHYGSLGVEDLGSIYEGLLELEPGIAGATGVFHLRAGNGRKSSGAYYTPNAFVRFLVREALAPLIAARSPADDPDPAALLRLRVVDPAAGSGHFLVEACRQLADAVLAAAVRCDELGLRARLAALPDPDGTLLPYLPGRGFNETRALAVCRRLVAVHCLYGADRNGLAVELAKLSLWLESYAEGLPLTFLDHRLVVGDALTGPFFDDLLTLPVTGGPLDPLLAGGIAAALEARLAAARGLVREMGATIGRDAADIAAKEARKTRLDALLGPLRGLAGAWAEAAMEGARDGDDRFLALAGRVAAQGSGGGSGDGSGDGGAANIGIAWDLAFPDVFPGGFDAVLGNPPWDTAQPTHAEFAASGAASYDAYRDGFDRLKRAAKRLYPLHRGAPSNLDVFRLFAERAMRLAGPAGAIGMLLPAAFHANQGAAGLRRLYWQQARVGWLLSFENRRLVFDIDSRFKFDALVAHRPGPTGDLRCGFYLERIEDAADPARIMSYPAAFLAESGGIPLELRGAADLRIAAKLFAHRDRLGPWCRARGVRFGRDLHMTGDRGLFLPPGQGDLVLREGKTFHQYRADWDAVPRFGVDSVAVRAGIARAAGFERLAFRDIARATDDRTMIAFVSPPGSVFGHTATVEKTPWARSVQDALALCAVFNSFAFDWLVRLKAATHLSLHMLDGVPLPALDTGAVRALAAAARGLSGDPGDVGLRARVDAMVARAYGLDRADYAHVLAGFAHRTDAGAAGRCLAAFDALG